MMNRRTTRRGSQRRGVATFLLVTLGVFGLMFAGSVAGTAGGMYAAYAYFSADLPDPRILDGIEPAESTYVYDRSGQVLLARFECQNREAVTFDELPPRIWQATVSSEDRTFWDNNGVDFQGTVRAALANLEAGEIVQGASTITQQVIDYARVLKEDGSSTQVDPSANPSAGVDAADPDAATNEQGDEGDEDTDVCQPPAPKSGTSIEDKIRENILAMQVTAAYPGREGKEKILETYLNLIYYGNGSYGIRAAAANYFGLTDLDDMTIAQAAFLAGLPQRPSYYDPYQNPNGEPGSEQAAAAAIARRNTVIDAMLAEGYITAAQAREARATSWTDMGPKRLTSVLREPQFAFRVRGEAERILASLGVENAKAAVRTGGYRITTTLDYALQQEAKRLVAAHVHGLSTNASEEPGCVTPQGKRCVDFNVNNGALVAIDSTTGEIVAYVGSVDYYNRDDPRVQGQFDVAGLGTRQPGSAFKPITYASAFKSRDATVSTMFVDALTEFGLTPETSYRPTNADIKERGPVLAMDALRYSMNIPSVKMQYLAGSQTTANFAESLGIASADYIMGLDPGLTLALGAIPINLTNMTQAYSAFANEGELHQNTTIIEIRDRNNRVVYTRADNGPEVTHPMTAAEAYLPHFILEGNTDPKRNLLWGSRAQLLTTDGQRRPAGFKTGTTNNFRDVSGFGYVANSLTVGVWMGNNNQEPMSNEFVGGLFSADGPLYLWHDFMNVALNKPWDWNGQQPVPQTSFPQPDGIVTAQVCRWSGMSATSACAEKITLPFLEGTVPPLDNVHHDGCLDLERYIAEATPKRPQSWINAADTWSDRVVNGETGARGDPSKYQQDPDVRFAIVPMYGYSHLTSVCGERVAPTPGPSPSGSPGASGEPFPSGQPLPSVPPSPGNGGDDGGRGGRPTPSP